MTSEEEEIKLLERFWASLMAIAETEGAAPINKHAGCWCLTLDKWHIAANGHREEQKHNSAYVLPFHIYVEYNGWPWGMIGVDGATVGIGSQAHLGALVSALEGRLKAGCALRKCSKIWSARLLYKS